ncbi:hypothetical protein ACIQ34_10185 [Ureibacillus sp. NPDC094379]
MIILYSISNHLIYDHSQAIFDQQSNLVDHQDSDNPVDDNGKIKDIITQLVLVLIVIGITSLYSAFASFTRRLMQLTTIFYQSNYLINSLK